MNLRGIAAVVADDHELFRAALAEVLRRDFGFRDVVEASSLDEAIDYLGRRSDVSFASIDLAMPGMAGASSLHAIRDIYPDVRIAIVSGSERRDDILQALAAGVHGYIPKTLRIAEITAAIKAILDGTIFVPAALAANLRDLPLNDGAALRRPDLKQALTGLSPRQKNVLDLIVRGKSNKEIARDLGLAEGTVKVHVGALFRAFGAHNRVGVVAALTQAQRPEKN